MQSRWNEFEELKTGSLNSYEIIQAKHQAIRFFLESDAKLTKIDGVSYASHPERYRKLLLQKYYDIAIQRKLNDGDKVKP